MKKGDLLLKTDRRGIPCAGCNTVCQAFHGPQPQIAPLSPALRPSPGFHVLGGILCRAISVQSPFHPSKPSGRMLLRFFCNKQLFLKRISLSFPHCRAVDGSRCDRTKAAPTCTVIKTRVLGDRLRARPGPCPSLEVICLAWSTHSAHTMLCREKEAPGK